MEHEIRWTENAFEDLKEVFIYLEKEWSSEVSNNFLDKCFLNIELISKFPHIGIRSEKDKTVRKILITKNNFLFYRVENKIITLLGLIDTRSDPNKGKY